MPQTRAALALRQEVETPAFILDLADVRTAYADVRAALPSTDCHYAIKANPHPDVLRTLHQLGCGFEVSSAAELRMVLDLGASPADVISSNPIKTPKGSACRCSILAAASRSGTPGRCRRCWRSARRCAPRWLTCSRRTCRPR